MRDTICERVEIPAPAGTLCGQLGYRMDTAHPPTPPSRIAGVLICSPHPYMGGHMDLPLLSTIADHLVARGTPTLRFDYGGVGNSGGPPFDVGSAMDAFWKTGVAPQDPTLIEEARCVLRWFTNQLNAPIMLIGYSFGALVASRICDDSTPAIALVAPTVTHHDYAGFSNDRIPTLVVAGVGDFATADDEMVAWVRSLSPATRLVQIPEADHFFRGSCDRVGMHIAGFIADLSTPAREASP